MTAGDYVWIGFTAMVLPGAEIGGQGIADPEAVVTCSIPLNSVVVGNLGRVLHSLSSENSELRLYVEKPYSNRSGA